VVNELAQHCPRAWPRPGWPSTPSWQRPINEASDKALAKLAEHALGNHAHGEGYKRPR
jgi:hypothetical protein